jgi:hypothetical protein
MYRFALIVLIGYFFGIQDVHSQQLSLDKIRDQFFSSDKSGDIMLTLYKSLEYADLEKNPVMLAYRGASSAAAAGSVGGTRKKLQYFNRGKGELERAVGLKPLDAEIRFLRLATQLMAPGFLGYSHDIQGDKAIILKTMSSVPSDHPNAYLYQRICSFMLTHAKLDSKEESAVKQLFVKFTPNHK